ncbi:MAG: hypothetical protein E6G56_00095 [Actinobacteria bacterium]|nr:MAG: hypothetical protein E6G56_00095 [Actinomycetota bacterium]
MPTTPRSIHSLRAVIDRLPVPTRVAMLEGVDSSTIIVGAYTSRDGGECPMLAAHRRGGRAEGGIDYVTFARTWDRFTGARGPRPATRRELGILRAQLQSSLLAEHDVDLAGAIREHRATTRGNEPDLATAISEHRELVRRRVEHEQPEREFGLIRALDRRSRDRRRRAAAYEQALDRL